MQIHYAPNPLLTKIELDERDISYLRLKVEIDELTGRIYEAFFDLEPGDHFSVDSARRSLDVSSFDNGQYSGRVDELLRVYIDALAETHAGDCTCVPCSCVKCHAENLLAINTLSGLGKHAANRIGEAFSDGRSIDTAISYLADYKPIRSGSWLASPAEAFERHVPRWTKEAKLAEVWLRDYQAAHFQS